MADFISTSETFTINTQGHDQLIDITDRVKHFVDQSEVQSGQVTVFTPGATASVTTVEYEPGLIDDIPAVLEELIPIKKNWEHNQTWGDGNGGSHLRATIIGPSLTVPVINSEMTLGTWQQIIIIDHDVRSRNRQIVLQVIGT